MGIIPANTQLQTSLLVNPGSELVQPHVELSISTTNETVIRTVMIFAEGVFEGESHVVHPPQQSLKSSLQVPVFPPKDIPVDLHIKAFVGNKSRFEGRKYDFIIMSPGFLLFMITVFLSRKHCLIVAPQKFDVFKQIFFWEVKLWGQIKFPRGDYLSNNSETLLSLLFTT